MRLTPSISKLTQAPECEKWRTQNDKMHGEFGDINLYILVHRLYNLQDAKNSCVKLLSFVFLLRCQSISPVSLRPKTLSMEKWGF